MADPIYRLVAGANVEFSEDPVAETLTISVPVANDYVRRDDLQDASDPSLGAGLVGYETGTVHEKLDDLTTKTAAASTTAPGIIELATNAETQTGTDAARAVTPAAMASVTATDTRRGLVELATSAEVQTGTDTERAVTPAGLAALTSTTSRRGLVELATSAEAQALTDADRAITPATLAAANQGSNQSLAANGYQRLPGGLILQWGYATTAGVNAEIAVTFPIAFPTAVVNVQLTAVGASAIIPMAEDVTTSGFTADTNEDDGTPAVGSVYWLAIGY